jgi:hypothetical protein
VASLYKNTSIACPFTKGSLGSCISRGTISVDEGVLEEVVREANVFDRGRKGDEDGDAGAVEDDPESAGCEGERFVDASDPTEWEREDMGTMRFWMFW